MIQGVIAVLISCDDGRAVVHVADFEPDRPGGFTLLEAQRYRCKARLGPQMMREMCSVAVSDHVSQYHAEQVLHDMIHSGAFRIEQIEIGHGAETKED